MIQHLSPSGQVLFEWNAFDHFDITDLPAGARTGVGVNFTHGNALELDVDGNILASFRNLSEVTKINATTGEVMWRLGGLANEFTFINDPKSGFQRQHGVRLAGPGQIATDYYPDGHAVVSFGQAGRVVEVDAAGNRAWELTGLDGTYVFRAERLGSLYAPASLSRAGR